MISRKNRFTMVELPNVEASLAILKRATECKIYKVDASLDDLEDLEFITPDQEKSLRSMVDQMEDQYFKYEKLWLENHIKIFEEEERFPVPDDESVYVRLSDEVEETQLMVGRLAQYVAHFCNMKLHSFEKEPQSSSKVDDIQKPGEGQDDLEIATKVLDMNMGIVNPKSKELFGLESIAEHWQDAKSHDQDGQNLDHLGQNEYNFKNVCISNRGRPPEIEVLETKGRKRGGEVDVPLQKQIVSLFEVGCDPVKHTTVKGGHLITNSKSRRHRATGLRTLDNSLDDPMEPDRFTPHRWKNYHRWPPPF